MARLNCFAYVLNILKFLLNFLSINFKNALIQYITQIIVISSLYKALEALLVISPVSKLKIGR